MVPEGLRGIGWVAGANWGVQAIRIATLTVLAGALTPKTFGIFAFALAIFTVAQAIAGLGLSDALVVRPNLARRTVATALALAAASGIAWMAIFAAGLATMRALNPQLGELAILGAMIPGVLLANLANVALAIPRRKKAFPALAMAILVGEAAGSAVGIALALNGHGIDSLVYRYLATSAVMAAVGLWLVRSHAALPAGGEVRELFALGWPVAGSETLAALRNRGDEMLIGLLFGAGVLGVYAIARRYVDALRSALPAVIGDHAWPVLASLRDDPRAFARQLRQAQLLVAGFVWPAFVALGVLAYLWVSGVLGPDWTRAVPVVCTLALVALIQSAMAIPVLAVVGLGHTAVRLRLDAVVTAVTLSAIVALSPLGLIGFLIALIGASIVTLPYQWQRIVPLLPVASRELLAPLAFPLGVNLAVAAMLVLLVTFATPFAGWVATISAGAAVTALVPLSVGVLRRREAAQPRQNRDSRCPPP